MKISIVIPCYNQAQYLPEAIESALNQTKKAHEIIVVNDGSPDETRYVAKQYPEIRYIEQVNKGLASARNTGLMNMTGDYFFPLDADDIMIDDCLQRITDTIAETNADIIAPSFKCFGKYTEPVILMPEPKLTDFRLVDGQPMNRIGYFSAIKKDALLEVGGYSPRMTFGWEDYHLWINLLSIGKKIVTIPEILMLYRTKERSMINEANEHATELRTQIHKDFPQW